MATSGHITSVSLVPPDASAPEEALAALAAADQIILGPGSLFTSVLAAAIVPSLRQVLHQARERVVYVCNLRPQIPETAGYDVAAHVDALAAHGVEPAAVVWDPAAMAAGAIAIPEWASALAREDGSGHDPARLAKALVDLLV